MNQTGYGFMIAAAPTFDGRVTMVASERVRDIDIHQDNNEVQWSGNSNPWATRAASLDGQNTKIIASLRLGEDRQHLVCLHEQSSYAAAWRRLFDIWVPPQFTNETRTQILTHYTFG